MTSMASARRCCAGRTTGISMGAASSSPTSNCPARWTSRLSAARMRMPGSGRSRCRPRRAAASSPRPICRGSSRSASSSQSTGAKSPPWPPLATDKVRYVGEAIAACIAPSRGEAEDLANAVIGRFRDTGGGGRRAARHARQPPPGPRAVGRQSLHRARARGRRHRSRRARGRGHRDPRIIACSGSRARRSNAARVLAYRDHRLDEVVVYASTQTPHTVRVALAEILDIEERRIRVVAPDVGGGFGPKARLYPEEIILAALALEARSSGALDRGPHRASADHGAYPRPPLQGHRLCRPAGPDARRRRRDHRRCRRLRDVAAGALSRSQHGGALPCRGRTRSRTTGREALHGGDQQDAARSLSRGRPPRARALRSSGPIDEVARAVGREPNRGALRQHGPARADAVHDDRRHAPTTAATTPQSVRLCAELLDLPAIRARQRQGEPDGRLIGIGFASFAEQTAHGAAEFAARGASIIPGFESCTARILTDGSVVLDGRHPVARPGARDGAVADRRRRSSASTRRGSRCATATPRAPPSASAPSPRAAW